MKDQLVIPIAQSTASMAAEDFIVTPANQDAYLWATSPERWPANVILIYGEQGSGKTHLATIWQRQNKARIITDKELSSNDFTPDLVQQNYVLDGLDMMMVGGGEILQRNLFHLLNAVREYGGCLLITARTPQAQWLIHLPDLKSRLLAIPAVPILPPDDMLLQMLLHKLFSDCQIKVEPEIIDYILPRVERSAAQIIRLVALIDRHALKDKRRITIPFVRDILKSFDGATQARLPL